MSTIGSEPVAKIGLPALLMSPPLLLPTSTYSSHSETSEGNPVPLGETASERNGLNSGDFEPSLNEWVVLALLAEAPAHGFALARQLERESDLGRILTVRRPLVYRALTRLADNNLCSAADPEPGESGPKRTTHRISRAGRTALRRWLAEPVDHVRDLRIEFLLKLRLTERSDGNRAELVKAQKSKLVATLDSLAEPTAFAPGNSEQRPDVVDRWRRHNAVAAKNFLDELAL